MQNMSGAGQNKSGMLICCNFILQTTTGTSSSLNSRMINFNVLVYLKGI